MITKDEATQKLNYLLGVLNEWQSMEDDPDWRDEMEYYISCVECALEFIKGG